MAENLLRALAQLRERLLDPESLVRGVGSGRQKAGAPKWRRVELRYVDLKAGRHLQLTAYDETQAHTSNHLLGDNAREAVDDMLDQPFGNWHVETLVDGGTETLQLRVTRKGEALLHIGARTASAEVDRGHDRDKERLLPESDPVFAALGLADTQGRLKPSRQAKYRQVEEFLHLLDTAITDAVDKGHLRPPTVEDPLRVVDLGCGNAYLTFAAERFLTSVRGLPVRLTGVDVRDQSREHNEKVAGEALGVDADFVVGSISGVELERPPEVVLALHACDTATDEALARAVEWNASLVLAAPCCHHDVAAQLRKAPTPAPYAMLTRHGILRERLADTLTDALRATLLRLQGYRVDVVQFVESKHTPRNTLLRATRTGTPVTGGSLRREYDDLVAAWGISPSWPSCSMSERLLAGLVVVPFLLGAAAAPVDESQVVFSFQDNEIIESSGLVVVDGLVVTTNDSGDTGRVFTVDPATGKTVGVTDWANDATDVEALAPLDDNEVWVGDIGDNSESRDTIQVAPVPVGPGNDGIDGPVYDLAYPDGPHNAETLMTDPTTSRLYVATKGVLGGTLYAAPATLSRDRVNQLRPVGDVLPIATDGAFLPDGKHLVIRNYSVAAIYDFPSLEKVDQFQLPSQQQGEGLAVDADGTLLLSSEGLHSDVLRVSLPSAPPSTTPTTPTTSVAPSPHTESHEDSELPESTRTERPVWPWFLGGLIGLGCLLVLTRSLRRR